MPGMKRRLERQVGLRRRSLSGAEGFATEGFVTEFDSIKAFV